MRSSVDKALSLLVSAARVSPPLREAVGEVEQEIRRLRTANDRLGLDLIEARNPGIDIDEVRRVRDDMDEVRRVRDEKR